ncbi:MAG: DUF302 domain-containing protein [Draconibacterium sp.]|nr:DUF302 domain-containing protein [Draconibacterium sp.]
MGITILYIVIGMLLMGVGVWIMMPKMMLTTYKSKSAFDNTVEKLKAAINSKGDWKVTKEFDFQKNIHDAGHNKIEKVGSIAICHPKYASMILTEEQNRKVTAIMPITLGVFENKNGQVFISELNIGMMGMMFGGTIANVMKIAGKEVNEIIGEATN